MGTGLYDAEGNELQDHELAPNMEVFSAEGDRHILLDPDTAAELEAEGFDLNNLQIPDDASELEEEANELTLATVGKAAPAWITGGASSAKQAGKSVKTKLLGLRDEVRTNPNVSRATAHVSRNRVAYGATGGAAAGSRFGKRDEPGLGAQVLAELSKAYTDGDRDQVISKVAQLVEKADQRAVRAETIAKALEERAEVAQYVELAKSYELPVDDNELGVILHSIAKNAGLNDDQLELVDQVFKAASEAVYTEEIGFTGRGDSATMEIINGAAHEVVGKADVTVEQAAVALLTQNPDAYIDYLQEG